MTQFNYPKKYAYMVAKRMRKLRALTEETAPTELNVRAEDDRRELVRVIDWSAYGTVINQLELLYSSERKNK